MGREDPLKDHARERQAFFKRVLVAAVLLLVFTGVLLARMAWLQIYHHDIYVAQSKANRLQVQPISPVRGLIYGRDGTVLADNKPAYRLSIVPRKVDNLEKLVARLSRLLPISPAQKERFFNVVERKAPFEATNLLLNMSPTEVARFEVNQMRFPGVKLHAGLTRNYPLGKVTAHVVGYVSSITADDLATMDPDRYRGSSQIGDIGIEKSYESRLHGYPGRRVVAVNAVGRELHEVRRKPPRPGADLLLTLDPSLQRAAIHALGDRPGAVVALNPRTGGILAMVSRPSFDPEKFVTGISQSAYQALLNSPHDALLNRATQGEYPPGSTVKPLMAIAGLASGKIKAQEKVYCPPYITLPHSDHRFRGWKRSGQGWVTLPQAIQRSADVYFYKLGREVGIRTIDKYAAAFGLGQQSGIDLPYEDAGLMPSPQWKHATTGLPWYPGQTLNIAIGQGAMLATPLQLAQMAARIAMRGGGYKPHLLKAWRTPDGKLHHYQPVSLKPITEPTKHDWQQVIKGMQMVVMSRRGTAYWYVGQDLDYSMAGKSGTSQVSNLPPGPAPDLSNIPWPQQPHALFISYAPVENPEIVVAAVVDHGGGGSSVAGPITREVIDHYMKHSGSTSYAPPEQWKVDAK